MEVNQWSIFPDKNFSILAYHFCATNTESWQNRRVLYEKFLEMQFFTLTASIKKFKPFGSLIASDEELQCITVSFLSEEKYNVSNKWW